MKNDWIDKWFEVKGELNTLALRIDEICYSKPSYGGCCGCPLDGTVCCVYDMNRQTLELVIKTLDEYESNNGTTGVTG